MDHEAITVAFELCHDCRCLAGNLPIPVNSTRHEVLGEYLSATIVILDLKPSVQQFG